MLFWTYALIVASDEEHYRISGSAWNNMTLTWRSQCRWADYNNITNDLFVPKKTLTEFNVFINAAMAGNIPDLSLNNGLWQCNESTRYWCAVWVAVNKTNECWAHNRRDYMRDCQWACNSTDYGCVEDEYDVTCP